MPNSDIKIRIATPEDTAGIADVQYKTWLTTYPNAEHGISEVDIRERLDKRTMEERAERWRKEMAHPGTRMWVARVDGKVVGFCTAISTMPKPEIGGTYILSAYQSQGIGSRLLQVALGWLGDEHDVYLSVVAYNNKAIGAYKKFGFSIIGPFDDPQAKKWGVKPLPGYEMIRKAKL